MFTKTPVFQGTIQSAAYGLRRDLEFDEKRWPMVLSADNRLITAGFADALSVKWERTCR